MPQDPLLQQVQLFLYRDDLRGALDLLDAAYSRTGNPVYKEHAERVRGWTEHLGSRESYAGAYEAYYRRLKGRWTPSTSSAISGSSWDSRPARSSSTPL